MTYTNHVSRKEGGRGLTCTEDCVDASIQGFEEDYIKKSKERQITAASNSIGNIRTDRKTRKTRKQNAKKTNVREFQAIN